MTRATPLSALARLACLWVALLAGIGCNAQAHPLDNSNTNWLRMCSSDDDCSGTARCLCGMCTTKDLDEDDCEEAEPKQPEPDNDDEKPSTSGSGAKDALAMEPSGMVEEPNQTEQPGDDTETAVAGASGTDLIPDDRIRPEVRIPDLPSECPDFTSGTITFAGLAGITIDAGPMGSGEGSLIFYWHGTGSTASEYSFMMAPGALNEIRARGGIIVSFSGSLGTGGDCSGTQIFSMDDFTIADQLAACAVHNYKIDPNRIYTTGCSAGGLQAGCMAAQRSSYIAAVVTNSGGAIFPLQLENPDHIPAAMTIHGGSGDMVAVSFTETSVLLDQQITEAGGFAIDCDHGGNHCGTPLDAQLAGWEFMKAHPFGVAPEPYAEGLPSIFPDYCQVF